jgi:hypothetical protein
MPDSVAELHKPDECATLFVMTPINDKDRYRMSAYQSGKRSEQLYTDKEIETVLRKVAKGQKGTLAREAYQFYYEQHENVPHSYTIIRRYGKWSKALEAAGLPAQTRADYRSKFERADCIQAIIAARKILGHLPSTGEYARVWSSNLEAAGHPSASTIRSKFGKWRAAISEASKHI